MPEAAEDPRPEPERTPSAWPVTPTGVLVGRASELEFLTGLLRGVARGNGDSVLIEGEPGIGKTALMRVTLKGMAERAGEFQVFWGVGDELGEELPLLPFLDALRVRAPSANARRSAIAALLRGEVVTDRGANVPALLAEQLIALIMDEATLRPTVLVIDDLQWADRASVNLWGQLARIARQVPLLLVGLTQPTAHREDLSALRRLVGDRQVQLTALAEPAVADLVQVLAGGRPDAELLRLAMDAAGNPLYLTELIAALHRSDGIELTVAGIAQLATNAAPSSLSAAIADRLGFVSVATRQVLRAAALLGVEFAVPDLTSVLGVALADLVPALDEARTTGVLTESEHGATLAFQHPLIREALYAELPTAVRSAWHGDAGHALADAGAPPDRVARQLLHALTQPANLEGAPDPQACMQAGTGNGVGMAVSPAGRPVLPNERPPVGPSLPRSGTVIAQWVLEWLAESADSLVGQAPGVAAELLGRVVAGVPEGSYRHLWLASRLADALYRTGDRAVAEQVAARALGYATGDPDLVGELHWTLVQCRLLAGHFEESFATIERALASRQLPAKHRARLLVLAARTHLSFGDRQAARREANSALTSAKEVADTWAVGWARHVLAGVAMAGGDMAGALALYESALDVAETEPALVDLALLLQVNKAVTLFNLDRCDEALVTAGRARRLAHQVGMVVRMAQAHYVLGQALYEIGRWDDALTEIAVVPRDLKGPFEACCDLGLAAEIGFHRNDPTAARGYLAAAEVYAERLGKRTVPSLALGQSLRHEQAGDLSKALAVLTAAFAANPDDLGEIEDLLTDTVRLACKTGNDKSARIFSERAAKFAQESEIPHRQANALYCRGLIDRDATVLLAAAQRYADAGRPLPRAKALEAAAGTWSRRTTGPPPGRRSSRPSGFTSISERRRTSTGSSRSSGPTASGAGRTASTDGRPAAGVPSPTPS
jgi:tetratricopeptide (TPR) repeat protein